MSDWHLVEATTSTPNEPMTATSSQPIPYNAGTPPNPADLLSPNCPLSTEWLQMILPGRPQEKLAQWTALLHDEEIRTVRDLRSLMEDSNEELWNALKLPVGVKAALRTAVQTSARAPPAEEGAPCPQSGNASVKGLAAGAPPIIKQLDCIVLDISGSMKSRSSIDELKTREDESKVVFHTMVDRILSLEMDHGVSLIAFGAKIHPVKAVTLEYESFHDEMGRLDARESATKLFDAIHSAAEMLLEFASAHPERLAANCPLRIFALTDGEDNASSSPAWKTASMLQEKGIILDALPLGPRNPVLQAMTSATGGLCLDAKSERQAIDLFQREALLHVAAREMKPTPARVQSDVELRALIDQTAVVDDVPAPQPKVLLQAPVLPSTVVAEKAKGAGGPAKRILKEYSDIQAHANQSFCVFVSEADIFQWKALVQSPDTSVYGAVWFAATIIFPSDYPFKPPKFRFATKVFHPNVNNDGHVCLDILKDQWSPALTIAKLLVSIQSLLLEPNPDDPLDPWKAQLYKSERDRYNKEAREQAQQHAFADLSAAMAAFHLA